MRVLNEFKKKIDDLKLQNPFKNAQYLKIVNQILELENYIKVLSDDQIRSKVNNLRKRYSNDPNNLIDIAESFALTREMSNRKLGLKHFETQLLGGLFLNDGHIAEMKTGEGKTLVATLPACYQALSGKGVHIITVNEYLARRDKELLQNLYSNLGFTVGLVCEGMNLKEKQKNYACDIVYTTNSEIGFDYLRDLMVYDSSERVLREFNYCVVDEVDSVLIDEAQTPLILSQDKSIDVNKYSIASSVSNKLQESQHYIVNSSTKQISLTEKGYEFLQEVFDTVDLYNLQNPWIAFVENALRAKLFYKRDQDYILASNEIQIIDKFTGRIAKGRKWSNGLHQAIEAKENIKTSPETQSIASVTYSSFFSFYKKLSGMTGTASSSENDFREFYNLKVKVVPPRRPVQRYDFPDMIFQTKKAKFKELLTRIKRPYELGQPILIGTSTIEDSEILASMMNAYGFNFQLLNAKPANAEFESNVVAQSGKSYSITIATNMAGRGTDIILGGNASVEFTNLVKIILLKILTPTSESLTFDLKYSFGILAESDFIELLQDIYTLSSKFNSADILSYFLRIKDIESYVPQNPLDIKIQALYSKFKLKFTIYLENQKLLVKELGGLAIYGTSRHESKRIDDQLRGRAGRQGDPGISQFLLSLEDDLIERYDPNIFAPFAITNSPIAFSKIETRLISKLIDDLQDRLEKSSYYSRKYSLPFEKIYEYYQLLYFAFRNSIVNCNNVETLALNIEKQINLFDVNSHLITSLNSDTAKKPLKFLPKQKNKTDGLFYLLLLLTLHTQSNSSYIFNKALFGLRKRTILTEMDNKWKNYAELIILNRETVSLQVYAQKDPIQEYKKFCSIEFYNLLNSILDLILKDLTESYCVDMII